MSVEEGREMAEVVDAALRLSSIVESESGSGGAMDGGASKEGSWNWAVTRRSLVARRIRNSRR